MTKEEAKLATCVSWTSCLMKEYTKQLKSNHDSATDLFDVRNYVLRDHCAICYNYKPVAATKCKPVSEESRQAYIDDVLSASCPTGKCEM